MSRASTAITLLIASGKTQRREIPEADWIGTLGQTPYGMYATEGDQSFGVRQLSLDSLQDLSEWTAPFEQPPLLPFTNGRIAGVVLGTSRRHFGFEGGSSTVYEDRAVIGQLGSGRELG